MRDRGATVQDEDDSKNSVDLTILFIRRTFSRRKYMTTPLLLIAVCSVLMSDLSQCVDLHTFLTELLVLVVV